MQAPEDWDEEEDGEWSAPLVANPKCKVGCGKWERPMVTNPAYKGAWMPKRIDNPDYKVSAQLSKEQGWGAWTGEWGTAPSCAVSSKCKVLQAAIRSYLRGKGFLRL